MAALTGSTKARLQPLQPKEQRFYATGFQLADQLLAQAAELLGGCTLARRPLRALEPGQALVVDKYQPVAEAQLLQRRHALYKPGGGTTDGFGHLAHRQLCGDGRSQKAATNPEGASRQALFNTLQQGGVNRLTGNGLFIDPRDVQRHRHQFRTVALPDLGSNLNVRPQTETP
ncbi:hypothetical protein D9M71_455400 [compost metagenome]